MRLRNLNWGSSTQTSSLTTMGSYSARCFVKWDWHLYQVRNQEKIVQFIYQDISVSWQLGVTVELMIKRKQLQTKVNGV